MNSSNSKPQPERHGDNAISKTVNTALLLDAYAGLLAERQRECLSLFYEEDLTLAEIGEIYSISRQAVHDAIRHGEAQLQAYEQVLHLVARSQERQRIIAELQTLTGNVGRIRELLERLA